MPNSARRSPQQILELATEVRGNADYSGRDHEQNEELLRLSRRTLALTEVVHMSTGAGAPGGGGPARS